MWTFVIPGKPVGKERAGRHTVVGPGGVSTRSYTPQQTVVFENAVKLFARQAGVQMMAGPVSVSVGITRVMPRSWSKARQREAISVRYATGKPDADNVLKAVMDSLNGISYRDDAQVAKIGVVRLWGEVEQVTVTVGAIAPEA